MFDNYPTEIVPVPFALDSREETRLGQEGASVYMYLIIYVKISNVSCGVRATCFAEKIRRAGRW